MMLRITVAVALPGRQEVIAVEVDEGRTVADALAAARVTELFPELAAHRWRVGIWSKPCDPTAVLRDGDRVEVYRPLATDPKDQRRERARFKSSPRSRSGP